MTQTKKSQHLHWSISSGQTFVQSLLWDVDCPSLTCKHNIPYRGLSGETFKKCKGTFLWLYFSVDVLFLKYLQVVSESTEPSWDGGQSSPGAVCTPIFIAAA